jgi:hypothetical protein
MSSENELHREHTESQSKYSYYLLSIAAACIALTLKRTQGLTLNWDMIWLGAAILSWGTSFIFGCKNRIASSNVLLANFEMLKEQRKRLVSFATIKSFFSDIIDKYNNDGSKYSKLQWRLLIAGAVFYIVWQVIQMMPSAPIPVAPSRLSKKVKVVKFEKVAIKPVKSITGSGV